jgi:hypothetical protein
MMDVRTGLRVSSNAANLVPSVTTGDVDHVFWKPLADDTFATK